MGPSIKINNVSVKIVEKALMMRAMPESCERLTPMIPEPTTTLTSKAVPENSATAFPTIFATGVAFLT
jgi:hypothetical protein